MGKSRDKEQSFPTIFHLFFKIMILLPHFLFYLRSSPKLILVPLQIYVTSFVCYYKHICMWMYAYISKQNLLSLNNAGLHAHSQGSTSSLVSRLVQVLLKFFHYQNKSGDRDWRWRFWDSSQEPGKCCPGSSKGIYYSERKKNHWFSRVTNGVFVHLTEFFAFRVIIWTTDMY